MMNMNMIGCSRPRLICGISRTSNYSLYLANSFYRPNRMITTTTTTTGGSRCISRCANSTLAAADPKTKTKGESPWGLIWPEDRMFSSWNVRFYCCAKGKIYSFFVESDEDSMGIDCGPFVLGDCGLAVGSSQGWIALHSRILRWQKAGLHLFDPTNHRGVLLPFIPTEVRVHSLTLSEEGKAFMVFGCLRRLAFCRLGRSHEWEWTPLGEGEEEEAYESIVYSNSRRRLLCLTSTFKLEAWDVADDQFPRLDWKLELELDHLDSTKIKYYLVCAEESGELYVVVHHDTRPPDFVVYKIEPERVPERVVKMKGSLGGLTMFVGIKNDPVAVAGKDAGVQPDSIYFTNGLTSGIFDYQEGLIRRILHWGVPVLMWYTPPHRNLFTNSEYSIHNLKDFV
ncbi:hypothetical protein OROGR_011820 [Orobanche gracilis]